MWRDLLGRPELTIAIPLHEAGRWVDVISENIAAAPRRSRIVLSDQSHVDGAMQELRSRHRTDPRVRFVEGDRGQGWRKHINELIVANSTPLFTILPQDDSISLGYYELLMEALRAHPGAGLAFPKLRALHEDGNEVDHRSPPFELGTRPAWHEAIALRREWNLGVPWRGVVRKRYLRPMLATPDDVWADLIWVFGIALEAHLIEVPEAVYLKRYHGSNTHGEWSPLPAHDAVRLQLAEVDRRLGRNPAVRAAARAELSGPAATARDEPDAA